MANPYPAPAESPDYIDIVPGYQHKDLYDYMKKVDAERQQAEVKVKEDVEATVLTNDKAIADLKAEVEDAITKIGIILKQKQTKDNSAPLDSINIVQNVTVSNEGKIESLKKSGLGDTNNLILKNDAKLKRNDESVRQ